jgi:hypothetical protein
VPATNASKFSFYARSAAARAHALTPTLCHAELLSSSKASSTEGRVLRAAIKDKTKTKESEPLDKVGTKRPLSIPTTVRSES